jgi:hypothetical protein
VFKENNSLLHDNKKGNIIRNIPILMYNSFAYMTKGAAIKNVRRRKRRSCESDLRSAIAKKFISNDGDKAVEWSWERKKWHFSRNKIYNLRVSLECGQDSNDWSSEQWIENWIFPWWEGPRGAHRHSGREGKKKQQIERKAIPARMWSFVLFPHLTLRRLTWIPLLSSFHFHFHSLDVSKVDKWVKNEQFSFYFSLFSIFILILDSKKKLSEDFSFPFSTTLDKKVFSSIFLQFFRTTSGGNQFKSVFHEQWVVLNSSISPLGVEANWRALLYVITIIFPSLDRQEALATIFHERISFFIANQNEFE